MPRARRLPIKNPVFAGLVGLIIAALVITLSVRLASASCSQDYRTDENVTIKGQVIHLQVAQTSKELERGLGGKKCISADQAMLFDLGRPADYSIWMKGMNFPIDIIWLNGKKEVVKIDKNVSPKTYPETFTASQPVRYVLETQAGQATQLGLREGDLINV